MAKARNDSASWEQLVANEVLKEMGMNRPRSWDNPNTRARQVDNAVRGQVRVELGAEPVTPKRGPSNAAKAAKHAKAVKERRWAAEAAFKKQPKRK